MSYLDCVHREHGLCPDCQAEYDYDPTSWVEFGRHREGEANWLALQEEMAAEAARWASLPAPVDDPTIPF